MKSQKLLQKTKARSKQCSHIQNFVLNLIEILKITTYNIKHTRNTKIYFPQLPLFQKIDTRKKTIFLLDLYGSTKS